MRTLNISVEGFYFLIFVGLKVGQFDISNAFELTSSLQQCRNDSNAISWSLRNLVRDSLQVADDMHLDIKEICLTYSSFLGNAVTEGEFDLYTEYCVKLIEEICPVVTTIELMSEGMAASGYVIQAEPGFDIKIGNTSRFIQGLFREVAEAKGLDKAGSLAVAVIDTGWGTTNVHVVNI